MSSLRFAFSCLFCIFAFFVTHSHQQECVDLQDWCPSISTAFCNTPDMKTFCPKRCDICPPPECNECSQNCTVGDDGRTACSCFNGFRLASDKKSCDDVDECSENKNLCKDEVCRNTEGGYSCIADKCAEFVSDGWILSHSYEDQCCKQTSGDECGQNAQNLLQRGPDGKLKPGRIIRGQNATKGMWPWQVHILLRRNLCGGSLINNLWIVSAAHCFVSITDISKQKLQVRLGVLDTTDFTVPGIQTRTVTRIIRHEKYDFPKYDIALLRMNKAVVTSHFIKPICLPNGEIPPVGLKCYVTGYGVTVVGGGAASYLQQVDLPIVDGKVCKKAYEGEHEIDNDIMICAGYKEGIKDACQGDSGGPLMCQRCDNCDWFLAGIVSFGTGCAEAGYYGVYTNVEYFEKWIESKISSVKVTKKKCAPIRWTKWGDWGRCTERCGGGTQSRIRLCMGGDVGKPGCLGDELQSRPCNENPCNKDSWSEWSTCSKSCATGQQTRDRICVTSSCREKRQKRSCNPQLCPVWEKWSRWSRCSKDCDGGQRTRTRSCVNGNVGDRGCKGSDSQTEVCNEDPCPKWGRWSSWSKCPATCGGGTQVSTRECLHGVPGIDCPGDNQRTRPCGTANCAGSFSDWSRWSRCTETCGGGTQTRTRTCPTRKCTPDEFGSRTSQTRKCNEAECTGEWTAWSPWDVCSKTCGPGTRSRIRSCNGGTRCPGSDIDTQNCNVRDCRGVWTNWSDWSICSATCDEGTRERTRTCDGNNCVGDARQIESCTVKACAVWSEWDNWSECSATCEKGQRTRTRICGRGNPSDGDCKGNDIETEECDAGECFDQCEPACQGYVRGGACYNNREWMRSFCHANCCTVECKDTWDGCGDLGVNFICGTAFYAQQCLRRCGYCFPEI